MTDHQMFDIGSLHAAYAAGRPVSEMIETVFARIEAVADPGIFLHLADRQALLEDAAKLGPLKP